MNIMIKYLLKTSPQTRRSNTFQKIFFGNSKTYSPDGPLPHPPILFYYLNRNVRKKAILTMNTVQQLPPETINKLAISSIMKKYGSKRIQPFKFHALSPPLRRYYAATITNNDGARTSKRMVFMYNQEGKIDFLAILPSHEYCLLKEISQRAENLKEVYEYFEVYNMYRFNRTLAPDKQYHYLLKLCIRKKFSESIIDSMKVDKDKYLRLMNSDI